MPTFHLDKNKIELQIDIDYQYLFEWMKCKSTLFLLSLMGNIFINLLYLLANSILNEIGKGKICK